jgi:hypothetical protein
MDHTIYLNRSWVEDTFTFPRDVFTRGEDRVKCYTSQQMLLD